MSKGMLGTLPLSEVRGPRDQLEECLAGEKGDEWLGALKRFLRKENPWPVQEPTLVARPAPGAKPASTPVVPPTIRVWKTIVVGGKSRDEIRLALEAAGFKVDDWARHMMSQETFTTESEPRESDIAILSVAELGFPKGATTREVWARANNLGLEFCPPSLGPHLRLAYGDQPLDEWIWVAMEAIIYPRVFRVGCVGDGRWLRVSEANPDGRWGPERRFAFVVPRKKLSVL